MARTALTAQTPKGPYPASVPANDLDYTYAALDPVNGNTVPLTGPMLVLLRNDDVAAKTVTLTSVVDELNRTGHVTAYSIGASEHAMFYVVPRGWAQTDGGLYIDCEDADIKCAVVALPR